MEASNLQGSVLLLTGATGATGYAIARALAGSGARLVLSGRRIDRLAALTAELKLRGGDSVGVVADLSERTAPRQLVEEALSWGGRLDGVVLCAGGARFTFFERLTDEELEAGLRLNFVANVELVREVLPHLKLQRRSWIIFINTIASRAPAPPRGTAYLPAKAALRFFADGLFSEIRDAGVSVTSILPDLTDTTMVPESLAYDRSTLIRPESVADAVVYSLNCTADVCVSEIHLRPQPSLRFHSDT